MAQKNTREWVLLQPVIFISLAARNCNAKTTTLIPSGSYMNIAGTSFSNEDLRTIANTIRMVSADGVEKANSGHPGMPMGMADFASVLWLKYLRFNPKEPTWFARDRFVVSNGHGSMLPYTMLHLAGFDLSMADLQAFRQWDSKTPGHPEYGVTPGIEATTGPLGQGISNAVGMMLGQKMLHAKYAAPNSAKFLDHRTFVFCGDGCLMEGVSSEASSLAGHLGLSGLIVVWDDNGISLADHTSVSFTEDVLKRYEAYGWHTMRVDGHDYEAIDKVLAAAVAVTDKPVMIAAKTVIGWGSPNKKDSHDVHGSPLGKAEMEATKKNLNWPQEPAFFIPDVTKKAFALRVEELGVHYAEWQKGYTDWQKNFGDLAAQLKDQLNYKLPADLEDKLIATLPTDGKAVATRKLSESVLQGLSAAVPALIGGSADLEPSTFTMIKGSTDVKKNGFTGKNIRFGVREHGMGSIMNGLSYYGGYIPYGSTFLCFSDYMRPTIRLAALSHLRGLFIFTHDSIFLGEDGPTHQPVEHLSSLRIIPNVHVFRPADGLETAMCYKYAVGMSHGPAVMVFSRQGVPPLARRDGFKNDEILKGGYVLTEGGVGGQDPQIVFVATGTEVSLALDAAKKLGTKTKWRVVSMPCCELYAKQPQSYKDATVPKTAKLVVCEAGASFGWAQMLGRSPDDVEFVCIDRFGASAPASVLAEKFGFTAESVAERVVKRFL
jgi:transketolase